MTELRDAQWVLNSLENGTANAADIYRTASVLDPVLIYFIFRYMREKFTPSNPASGGVVERMVHLTSTYDDLVKVAKKGEKDPIREWFDDTYRVRDYFAQPEQLLQMVVEKIEG